MACFSFVFRLDQSFSEYFVVLCYNGGTMKKVILQYLASALTVILILGLVVFDRHQNQYLVTKVNDPEISYIYQDSLENLDKLALSRAGVIQSYQLGRKTGRFV